MSADPKPVAASIETRIVRYAGLVPCKDAFIDTRSPGSDQKENFTIIGPGVAENPNQHVHINEHHGFNIGGARQPPRCLNSQHSHDTAEVFYVHSGHWRFMTGERGTDGEVFMGPGDLISIPTRLFRGFENVGEDTGFLWAVLGGDDAGHVMWAPYVFDMARDYGLVLLEDGTLVDTAKGEALPSDARPMPETTAQQVAALSQVDSAALAQCVIPADMLRPAALHTAAPGVTERLLIGAAPIDWLHGFTICEATLAPAAAIAPHRLAVPDVWFVQDGDVTVSIDGENTVCSAGDTITVPQGAARCLANQGSSMARVVQVRGGDTLPVPEAV
jgi:mannose-6-phosphate isomerase-like protein (cupin superfamily)